MGEFAKAASIFASRESNYRHRKEDAGVKNESGSDDGTGMKNESRMDQEGAMGGRFHVLRVAGRELTQRRRMDGISRIQDFPDIMSYPLVPVIIQ